MYQLVINHCLQLPQLTQHPVVVVLAQQLHQLVPRHLVVVEDLNVPAVLIALRSGTVVYWEQPNLNVSEMDVFGVHHLFKESHGVFTNQEAAQQLNLHLVGHPVMFLIVLSATVVMLVPINSRVKQMDVVGNQLIQVLVYHGVTFLLEIV